MGIQEDKKLFEKARRAVFISKAILAGFTRQQAEFMYDYLAKQ